jgi:hypothetical protein
MISRVDIDGMSPVRFDGTITIEASDPGTVRISISQPTELPLRARPDDLFDCWVHWLSMPAAFSCALLRALRP